ncbi:MULTISPECIES: MotA/TolQ/ExbB proton channel family protein [unclassified Vibrio]|uniref:MotA/TolQ/ExbB proton channel family protein n=1 Tax=unclassified Vibrio TaxID=2614977 RepID=UPI001360DA72|nr:MULTISPECIES: MotA/TolQ/ExbB proton channel family protein [unclassified Vibrio]NAW57207.1 MotA/TolQ/ExbB proton channel family protein [Vibrio sp. V36_P2S2PM302]NAX26282.1 MotA/TolQ/ExbB proton channel family protein [Vibrio sp. V38_P2S17PM301]NAX28546.1 MotA/TolQ/ExbB proton channel family protein [Vibrio sp. V37_P2S8PM304]
MNTLFSFSWLPASITSSDWALSLSQFMQQGGQVLWWLAAVVLVSWLLVTERILYITMTFPKQKAEWIVRWQERHDQSSWYARSIREGWIGEAHIALNQNLSFIKVLVAICPMLGLLGTVTGMISVFDVMAAQGSSNPKLMASGISLATLPTMAGMVAALAGMFVHARLAKACNLRELKLEQALRSQS